MLVLLVLSAASLPSIRKAELNAQVSVRVLRAVTASKTEWNKSASPHRKEILVKEPGGKLTRVRIIEYE
jgi:hypothetical protein